MKTTLSVEVELGRCQERSNIVHVLGERMEVGGDRPKCGQGRMKFVVGKVPTELTFPVEGDVSQVKVKGLDGLICARCLKSCQSEEAAKRAPVEAPAEPPKVETGPKTPAERIQALKDAYLTGMMPFKSYYKQAKMIEKAEMVPA